MKHLSKKRVVVLGAITSLALGAVAFAYFTSTGTGTGSATVGNSTAFTIASSPATGAALTPGGPSQTVAYTVTNPSAGQQNLNKVAISVANSDGTPWDGPGTCSAADFQVNGAAAGSAYDDTEHAGNLAASQVVNNTVTIQMIDTGVDQDDCRLATVPLYFSAS